MNINSGESPMQKGHRRLWTWAAGEDGWMFNQREERLCCLVPKVWGEGGGGDSSPFR